MKKKGILIFMMVVFLFVGCQKKETPHFEDSFKAIKSENPTELIEKIKREMEEESKAEDEGNKNPFTGYSVATDHIPFMTIIENTKSARPQTGLSMADIVFEFPVERPITRFLAIFYSNVPDVIGPIRSTREYIQEVAASFDLPYAHCGGSFKAIEEIRNGGFKSLNEMANLGYYFRDKNRKAPHNLYITGDSVIRLIGEKNYQTTPSKWLKFGEEIKENSEENFTFTVKPTSYVTYRHDYLEKEQKYSRYVDGKLEIDKSNQEEMKFSNVGLLEVKIKDLKDADKHIDIDLNSGGKFILFRNGIRILGNWTRSKENQLFYFEDEQGNEIEFKEGNSWFYFVEKNSHYLSE